jgi:hypothetical protein
MSRSYEHETYITCIKNELLILKWFSRYWKEIKLLNYNNRVSSVIMLISLDELAITPLMKSWTLHNASATTLFKQPVWRYTVGWRAKMFSDLAPFHYSIFYNARSHKTPLLQKLLYVILRTFVSTFIQHNQNKSINDHKNSLDPCGLIICAIKPLLLILNNLIFIWNFLTVM